MDLPTIAMDVGEIKSLVKMIAQNQEKGNAIVQEHDRRITSLESRRWLSRVVFTGLFGVSAAWARWMKL